MMLENNKQKFFSLIFKIALDYIQGKISEKKYYSLVKKAMRKIDKSNNVRSV